jgi:hypothetical protein
MREINLGPVPVIAFDHRGIANSLLHRRMLGPLGKGIDEIMTNGFDDLD